MENEFVEEVPEIDTASVTIDDSTFKLTRHPINLFGLAVMHHFRGETDEAHAFLWRFLGLQMLLHHNQMSLYITGSSDSPRTSSTSCFGSCSSIFESESPNIRKKWARLNGGPYFTTHQHEVHEYAGAKRDEQKNTEATEFAISRHDSTKLSENSRADKRFSRRRCCGSAVSTSTDFGTRRSSAKRASLGERNKRRREQ